MGGVGARLAAVALTALAASCLPNVAAAARHPDWYAVARCETGGLWDWGAKHRRAEGSRYEGGVGFAASTWRAWAHDLGLLDRYPHAYLAPVRVQIRVAEYGWERGGYWGCLAN